MKKYEEIICQLVAKGRVPQHVAMIMDGNRRWAEKQSLEKKKGHAEGFRRLAHVIEQFNTMGVKSITVYAFSIDNMNRPKDEIDGLMGLAHDQIVQALRHSGMVHDHNVQFRCVGDLSLAPPKIRDGIAKLESMTKGHSGMMLNLAFFYSGPAEVEAAVRAIDVDAEDPIAAVNEKLWTAASGPPDLLIRTSGEVRLSNFMVWQAAHASTIMFIRRPWPALRLRDLVWALLKWRAVR